MGNSTGPGSVEEKETTSPNGATRCIAVPSVTPPTPSMIASNSGPSAPKLGDDLIRSELAQTSRTLGAGRQRGDVASGHVGQLHREPADAPAGAGDQDAQRR